MKKINALFLVLLMSVVMVQCTKTGPVGPAGPAGATGATGPASNANVQTVILSNRSFIAGSTTFLVPAITQNILDSGVVVGYLRNTGASVWYALPLINGGNSLTISSIELGSVIIQSTYAAGGADFKFDIIAGHQ